MSERIVMGTLILVLLAAVPMTGCTLAPPSPTHPTPAEAHCQTRELLSRYGWTTTGQRATHRVTLPQSFKHRPGQFPIPIYWAYDNELSKAIGLDLSPYLGQRVEATVYELQEELEFLRPYTEARAVVVTHKGKIIGAWIDKGRHLPHPPLVNRLPFFQHEGLGALPRGLQRRPMSPEGPQRQSEWNRTAAGCRELRGRGRVQG